MASASVPFRFKLAAVWLALFGLVAVFFALSGFDTAWMRENLVFIAGGPSGNDPDRGGGDSIAIALALLGSVGQAVPQPDRLRSCQVSTRRSSGAPRLIVQMFLIYLALPQIGRDAPPWLRDLLILDAVPAGHPGSGPQLRRLHDRDLPRRNPVGGRRPNRGGRSPGDELFPEDAGG